MMLVWAAVLAAFSVLFFFGVGQVLLRNLVRGAGRQSPVVSVVVGQAAVVSVYALVVSHGRTSLGALLLALLAAAWIARRLPPGEESGPPPVRELAEQALVAGVSSALLSWTLLLDGQPLLSSLQQDNSHYTRLASFLNAAGGECYTASWIEGRSCQRGPYHFFDIWLAALLGRTGLPMALAFSGVVSGLLISNLYATGRRLAERLGAGSWARLVIAATVVLSPVGWVRWLPENRFLSLAEGLVLPPLVHNKLLPSSLGLMLAVYAWSSPARPLVPLVLAAVGASHATFLPFVGVAIGVLLLHDLLRGERERALAGAAALGCLAVLAGWYAFEGRLGSASHMAIEIRPPGYMGSKAYFVGIFKVVMKTALQLVVFVLPLAALALLTWQRSAERAWLRSAPARLLLVAAGLGLAASLTVWGVIHHRVDSVQVTSNVLTPLFLVLVLVLLSRAVAPEAARRQLGRGTVVGALLLGAASVWGTFHSRAIARNRDMSPSFLASAHALLGEQPRVGVYLVDAAKIDTIWKMNMQLGCPGYLTTMAPSSFEVQVPVGVIPLTDDPGERNASYALLGQSAFFRFTGAKSGEMKGDDATIQAFLDPLPLDHVICEGEQAQVYCDPDRCAAAATSALCREGGPRGCVQEKDIRICRLDR